MTARDSEWTALDDAIERQEWLVAFDSFASLLEKLPPRQAVLFAAAELMASLEHFKRYRPKAGWPQTALKILATGMPLPADFDFSPDIEGANPIVTHFLDGLDQLDLAAADQEKPAICAKECSRAILCALNTRRYAYFAKVFPQDWRIVVKREAGAEDLPRLKTRFMEETAVQEYTYGQWRELRAALESRLG